MIIDHSSHDSWVTCPANWYEKYQNRRRKRWPAALREDALALGSLVHEGLRLWQETHTVGIPQAVTDEMTPTPECLNLALELVYGYAQKYPQEEWPLIVCEEPVLFPLPYIVNRRVPTSDAMYEWEMRDLTGLAKIDAYFLVEEPTILESGIGGIQFLLSPGWWIHEYKTKSPKKPIGAYMAGWETGFQASYQCLALAHKVKELGLGGTVQGVLVNVLEKPDRYIPKRKCKSCQEQYEFATWLPTGTGEYACPVCGNRQVLQPLKQGTPIHPPNYYRLIVTRDSTQLEQDRRMIIQVGQAMIQMELGGLESAPWNKRNCGDLGWGRPCEYAGSHKNGISTIGDNEYDTPPDYRGLIQLEPSVV